jgi:tellurite resistance protein TerC
MIYNYPDWLADIPTEWALGVTAALIFGSILASIFQSQRDKKRARMDAPQ